MMVQLSPEKEFQLVKYSSLIPTITRQELEELFVELLRQKLAQEELFCKMLKQR